MNPVLHDTWRQFHKRQTVAPFFIRIAVILYWCWLLRRFYCMCECELWQADCSGEENVINIGSELIIIRRGGLMWICQSIKLFHSYKHTVALRSNKYYQIFDSSHCSLDSCLYTSKVGIKSILNRLKLSPMTLEHDWYSFWINIFVINPSIPLGLSGK